MTASVSFAFGSCQYPWGILDRDPAQASWSRLANRLAGAAPADRAKAVVLLGDQVYLDATAGLFDPTAHFERYTRPYQRLREMESRSRATKELGLDLYCMIDDHEIEENWEPLPGDPAAQRVLQAGRAAYARYQRAANPPTGDSLAFDFVRGGLPFFMADTRTEREPRTAATVDRAKIMSETQFAELIAWLDRHKHADVPKFIASPAILLPRRLRATLGGHAASALRSDAWDGYPSSLSALLAHIAENEIRNVVFLSGDEHLSCVASGAIRSRSGRQARVHSVHSSALYAPFPFANSVEADLAAGETFGFESGSGSYCCAVETQFAAPGDGFCLVTVSENAGVWTMRCDFDRDPAVVPQPCTIVRTL